MNDEDEADDSYEDEAEVGDVHDEYEDLCDTTVQPTGECDFCGANIYGDVSDEEDVLCDECEWEISQGMGDEW